ncbi:MAG TPA: integrase core domain-containing protein [Gaiellaceae bacterium]|nr:integrase core domain-containing protein [Gaiellaceae bacterium]
MPRQLLSDNGLIFTGRLYGLQVAFERRLSEAGVELINAAPAHPQTLGKLERFHRTLKEWLAEEGPPLDLEHLQLLLDRFRDHYNHERPHQGIRNHTPAERYLPGRQAAKPLGELTPAEARETPRATRRTRSCARLTAAASSATTVSRSSSPAATPAPASASSRSAS